MAVVRKISPGDRPNRPRLVSYLSSTSVPKGSYGSRLSPELLVLCWLGFLALHAACFVFFAVMSLCYWYLPGTLLEVWLNYFHITWSKNDRVVAVVHGFIAGLHLTFILWMVVFSFSQGKLVFAVYDMFVSPSPSKPKSKLSAALAFIVSKIGLVDIDGPYFDFLMLVREIVETAMQTNQAYRMTQLTSRTLLSRGYVILLILNCWSTSIVHFAFSSDEPRRRFYAIICDSVLDMATSVGITTALAFHYIKDFDFEIRSFPTQMWYENVWAVHVFSELQIILVTSASDLAMRVIFALSLVSNMNNMKKILKCTHAPTEMHIEIAKARIVAVVPATCSNAPHSTLKIDNTPTLSQCALHNENRVTQVLFFVWGVVILVLQLYAESVPALPQCKMQCKPWFNSRPSCALLVVDCYDLGVAGAEAETISQWGFLDATTTVSIAIHHCPAFEMPAALNDFTSLRKLKMYNTTIANWDDKAALTEAHHPKMMMLYLARVNFTDGELPAGLLSDDFPRRLTDIEFCVTNLRTLPDDFDTKWSRYATIYLEAGELTEIPPSLARLAPYDISVAMNPIFSVPAEIFGSHVWFVHIGGTLVSALPEHVTNVSSMMQIRVDGTSIPFFWSWIDPALAYTGIEWPHTIVNEPVIAATGTPYCSELQRVFGGEQSSLPYHEKVSPILSNVSVGNWPFLQQAVGCEPRRVTWYPIEYEDMYSAIQQP